MTLFLRAEDELGCDRAPDTLRGWSGLSGGEAESKPMKSRKFLIISMRRTGGTLVNNLLDGHPACSVFPFEFWNTRHKATYDRLRQRLFPWMTAKWKLAHCGRENVRRKKFVNAHGSERWPDFGDELLERSGRAATPAELYDLTAELYFERYHPGGLNGAVVNHCANLCLLSSRQIEAIFGEARRIMTVRDPRATFASTERKDQQKNLSKGRTGEAAYRRADVEAFCDQWRRAVETYFLHDRDAIHLRFEDLVSDPRPVMTRLAAEMEIPFDEILLTPTSITAPVAANTSFSRRAGIDPGAASSWEKNLSQERCRLIEARLGDIMKRVGYEID
jgi:hypothetical protein